VSSEKPSAPEGATHGFDELPENPGREAPDRIAVMLVEVDGARLPFSHPYLFAKWRAGEQGSYRKLDQSFDFKGIRMEGVRVRHEAYEWSNPVL
jgi:hypothetical protein